MSGNPAPVILIADDESNIRLFLQEVLQSSGCEVFAAEDGVQALELIEQRNFDLAVLDLNMPRLGGLEVVRVLHEKHPDTVVILLTAYGTLENAVTAMHHNVHDLLLKPCKPVDIWKSILEGLEERRRRLLHRDARQLISLAAHELRNAATGVSLSAEMLRMSSEADRPRYFDALKSQTRRLSQIASDILDLTKIREHANQPKLPLDLNAFLDEMLPLFIAQGSAKGLHITWQPELGLPQILGSEVQLQHACSNIISNALNYTIEGEVAVSTRLNMLSGRVGMVVHDTGLGIDPDDIPRLFDRFYRGKTVTQAHLTGSGLGLAIVKEIMDAHGGTVDVESQPGVGSVFALWFPVATVNASATNLPQDTHAKTIPAPLS